MEEARATRQLGPVELDRELHVGPRLLEPASHLILAHARVVDVLVEGTPIRTGWAPGKRASSSQQPNGEATHLQLAKVPRAPVRAGANVEGPAGKTPNLGLRAAAAVARGGENTSAA
eukprot:12981336-Alexandrium_andersonii.AAC.1